MSGYTYRDAEIWDGKQIFVLWDRDTESLWWPAIGTAVSGPLIDTPLPLFDRTRWAQTQWGPDLRAELPDDAVVLDAGQTMSPPAAWPRLTVPVGGPAPATDPDVAPGWGDNGNLTPPDVK